MNQAKHSYNSLGHRLHETPVGLVPGVTTVLGETKDKTFLTKWKAKVGEEEAARSLREAIDRGSNLHAGVEATLAGEEFTPNCEEVANTEIVKQMLSVLLPFVAEIKPLHVEQATYHPLGFGGSPDLVGEYGGKVVIFDWKNSVKPKQQSYVTDYFLQLAAYSLSVEYTLGLKADATKIVVCTFKRGKPCIQEFDTDAMDLPLVQNAFVKRLKKYQSMFDSDW
jgi:genome maintenance exonuclease 1